MYAINDALADQIIRAAITDGPAGAGRYLSSTHANAMRSMTAPAPRGRRVSPVAAMRAAQTRIVALFAAPAPASPACCATA